MSMILYAMRVFVFHQAINIIVWYETIIFFMFQSKTTINLAIMLRIYLKKFQRKSVNPITAEILSFSCTDF